MLSNLIALLNQRTDTDANVGTYEIVTKVDIPVLPIDELKSHRPLNVIAVRSISCVKLMMKNVSDAGFQADVNSGTRLANAYMTTVKCN